MSTLSTKATKFFDQTDMNTFGEWLSRYLLLDLGIITSCLGGRATVQTFRVTAGQRIIYEDVEILHIGGSSGYIEYPASGALCLLVRPLTVMTNCKEALVNYGAEPYAREGMKCIPLMPAMEQPVNVGFDDTGSFNIGTDIYQIACTEKGFSLSCNGAPVISCTQGRTAGLSRTILDNGITQDVFFTDNKVTHAVVHDADGILHIYSNPSQDIKDPDDLTDDDMWDTVVTVSEDVSVEIGGDTVVTISDGEVKATTGSSKSTVTINDKVSVAVGTTVTGEFSSSGIKLAGAVGSVEIS